MIPLAVQDELKALFDEQLKGPVKVDFFTQRPLPVAVPGREDCRTCPDVSAMWKEISRLSAKVTLRVHERGQRPELERKYGVERAPASVIRGPRNRPILYHGTPMGTPFEALITLIVACSQGKTDVAPEYVKQLKRLERDIPVHLYVTPIDPVSPMLLSMFGQFALEQPRIKLTVTEVTEYEGLAERVGIRNQGDFPLVIYDNRTRLTGMVGPEAYLEALIQTAESQVIVGNARLTTSGLLELPPARAPGGRAVDPGGEVRPSGLIIPRH